ncbi:muscle M-line assembly protein unc-89-like isoform X3 [Pungitius pungitius]|uniref:muscle M-line assembly protein unc-89-like isoform X3 n=1 Tax=Pungitius pungitius TaxID=134920 RepID=UPI002E110E3F
MAAWYFLIFFLIIPSCLVAGQTSTFGLKGGNASLKPDITGQPDGILWKFKGNKVAEFDGKEQHVYGPYKNRITLDWVTAELTIAHLRLEDSGDYELEIEINNVLRTSYYALEVMDKVSRPTISCKMKEGGSVISSGELVCSAEPQPSLKFEWGASGKLQVGPKLQIPLGEEHDDEVYSCSVSNLLSKETTTFTAKDCYPEESSSVAAITIAVIIIALVLLLVCVAIFWLKRHNKACFAEDDLEKQSSPGSQEGSNKKEAQKDEKRNLVHRESTLPSVQKLFQRYKSRNPFSDKQNEGTDSDHEEAEEMPKKGHVEGVKRKLLGSKEPSMIKQEETPNKGHVKSMKKRLGLEDDHHEGDADAVRPTETPQEKVPLINQSDSVEKKDPKPAGVMDHVSEDKESSPDGSKSPEHPEPSMTKQEETQNKSDCKTSFTIHLTEPPQEKVPLINQSDSVEKKNPEPAGVMDHVSEDKESSPEGPKSPEHPEPLKGSEAQSTDVDASPADQALSPLTQSSLNMDPKDQKDVTISGDADAVRPTETPQEKVPLINQSDSVEEKDPEPAGGSDHVSEDKKSSPEGSKSTDHPEFAMTKTEPLKEAEAQSTDVEASPADQGFSPLTKSSLNMGPKDQKDVTISGDADAVRPTETPQENVPLINQSDSVEEKNPEPAGGSNHVSGDKKSSPEGPKSPEHPGLETTIKPKMIKQEEMPNEGHVKRVKKRLGLEDDHHEGDADAVRPTETPQEKVPLINQSDSVEEKDPEPAGGSDHVSEDKESSPEGPKSPEHPEPLKEAEAQSTHVEASPADQELSPLTQSSLNMGPKDQKDVTISGDADAVLPTETPQENVPLINQSESVKEKNPEPAGGSDHVSEDKESSPEGPKSPEHPEPLKETSTHVEASAADQGFSPLTQSPLNMGPKDQKDVTISGQVTGESAETKFGESDSSGEGKGHESDHTDESISTDLEQKGSRTSTEPEENNTNAGEHEETDMNSANSHQRQSPRTKPAHSTTDTDQQSSDAARGQPDEEEEEEEELETCPESHDTEGQLDKGEAKVFEVRMRCGFKGERPNDSCSGDEAGQKEHEGVSLAFMQLGEQGDI